MPGAQRASWEREGNESAGGGGWQQLARQRELVYKGSGKKLGGGGT